jgi:hypothetical protein
MKRFSLNERRKGLAAHTLALDNHGRLQQGDKTIVHKNSTIQQKNGENNTLKTY